MQSVQIEELESFGVNTVNIFRARESVAIKIDKISAEYVQIFITSGGNNNKNNNNTKQSKQICTT
jgi:hypothetical protein